MKQKLFILMMAVCCAARSQEIKIPMEPKYWNYDTATAEFVSVQGVPSVRAKKGGLQIFLKNQQFSNGTLEYDVALSGIGFPGIVFRMSDDKKYGENFYIRSFGKVTPIARTTLQYATIIDGTSMWDLSDEYQSGAAISQDTWNHIKLVISGKQMLVYVNDMSRPALLVPKLEGTQESGGISLSGNVLYANFKLIPNATEGLPAAAGMDITANDTRYLRKWQVTGPVDFPFGKEIVMPLPSAYGDLKKSELPDSTTIWKPLLAGDRGVLNLSRIYHSGTRDQRRLAWIKTTIHSDKAQEKILRLGFSDEVWVFINGQILYVDKNYFGTPEQKEPRGRCSIDNTTIRLPLVEGDNTVMIALSNYFYGWGIVARFDDVDGLMY